MRASTWFKNPASAKADRSIDLAGIGIMKLGSGGACLSLRSTAGAQLWVDMDRAELERLRRYIDATLLNMDAADSRGED